MLNKENLAVGVHRLWVRKTINSGAKVMIAFQPLDTEGKEVLRTFDFRSKSLCVLLGKILNRFVEEPSEALLKEIEGRVVSAQIGLARNPNYVNLEDILESFNAEQSLILIRNPQSNDPKIATRRIKKKR